MAKINVESGGAAPLSTGELQLNNGVAMSTTLTSVTDQNNTASPLKLSTTDVQVNSTLRITTDSNPYIDAEDGSTNNRFTVGRDPASQQVNVDFASNPAGSTTTVGAIRTYTDGLNLGEVVKFREDGQVTFTERVNVETDSLVTTQSSSVIAASTTNANLVIAPNGTGALIADIPDATATGGNARGLNAVDLSTIRTLASHVASGQFSAIGGGYQVTASGTASVVNGGNSNTASGEISTVGGGSSNTASSTWSTVSGGQSNTASTNTHATVVGGRSNTSSGANSVSGGFTNTASGDTAIALGYQCTSTSDSTFVTGFQSNATANGSAAIGIINNASAAYATAIGCRSNAYLRGQFANAGNNFTNSGGGDCQNSLLNALREATLTTGATTTLSLDGTGTTNLIIPNGNLRSWNVQVRWVAVVTAITGTATGVTVGDTKVSTDLLAVAKRSGVTTVGAHTSAGTSVIETIAGSLTTANITYSAGASQEMAITFTGPTFAGGGSVTMRVVAAISLTEVAYV